MKKTELLKALQFELREYDLDHFRQGSVVVPGCPACKARLNTVSNFIDHICNGVLPPNFRPNRPLEKSSGLFVLGLRFRRHTAEHIGI
jgi:hypothetical protein